jgi:hypothetical protein
MSDFAEWLIVIGGAALMFCVTHISLKTHKRYILWGVGLAGIGLMVWFKGATYMWTWLLAACWLGVLAWLDRRVTAPDEAPAVAANAKREGAAKGTSKIFGKLRRN